MPPGLLAHTSLSSTTSPFSTEARSAPPLHAYLPRCLDVNYISYSEVRFVDHESGTKVPIPSLFLVRSLELQDLTIPASPLPPSSPVMDSRSPAETLTTNKPHAHEWYITSFRLDSQMLLYSIIKERIKIVLSSVPLPLFPLPPHLHPTRTVRTVPHPHPRHTPTVQATAI